MTDDPLRGRGSSFNPPNRFDRLHYEPDPEAVDPDEEAAPTTLVLRDASRSLISYNDSPDIGFDAAINPYRGCEHGCIYCYARPYHEFLGFSAGLDFETKILAKPDAAALLRAELNKKSWRPQVLAISGVTDCYQPIERHLKLTRQCLEVLTEFRNPVAIITKNRLVTRDIDLLGELARHGAAIVYLSLTTLDAELARVMEPRASAPASRLAAIEELTAAGIPVGVMTAPVIPGLNDHELPALVAAAAKAGARHAGYTILRLPHSVVDLFERWLTQHFPDRKERVLGRIRDLREGKLNEAEFGRRMRGTGPLAEMIRKMFELACKQAGIQNGRPVLSTEAFRRPGAQPLLFDL
ncbi:MAG: PA0069 family radical SAM protein [Gemmataceae bacterium]